MKKIFSVLVLLAAFVLLIILPEIAAAGVREALALCGQVILPSLFPFLVCGNLCRKFGYFAILQFYLLQL